MPCAPPPGRVFYGGGGSSGGGGLGLFSGKGGGRGFFSGKGGGGGGFFRRRGSDDPPHTNRGSGVNGSSMSTNGRSGVDPAGLREQLIMAHSRNSDSSFAYAGSRTPAQPATEVIPCHVLERLYQECVDKHNKSCEFYFRKLSIRSTKSENAPPMPSPDVGRNGGVAPEHLEPCYHSERVYQVCLKKYGGDHIACQRVNRRLFNCRQHSSLVVGMVP